MTTRSTMTIPEGCWGAGHYRYSESLNGIHARFQELVKEWHPDVSQHDPDLSHVMFIRIKEAYDILVEYGMNYELSSGQKISGKATDYESGEFWMNHFGDDPIWG